MRTTLALASVLLITTPAAAQSLLLELGWENQPQQLPAVYFFGVSNDNAVDAGWFEQVTSYPYHSFASPELVERFSYLMTGYPWRPVLDEYFPIVEMGILDKFINDGGHVLQGPERPALCTSCRLRRLLGIGDISKTGPEWQAFAESVGWNVDLRVPLLGQALTGYTFTSIERIVTAEAQTIRFYGVVPEPASWLLACLALCWLRRHR